MNNNNNGILIGFNIIAFIIIGCLMYISYTHTLKNIEQDKKIESLEIQYNDIKK